VDERLKQATEAYELSVFGGDSSGVADAERGLAGLEAEVALARGRLLHTRFLNDGVEDPDELPLFIKAAELSRDDPRARGEALFWIGIVHQLIRNDHDTALGYYEQALTLATQAGDKLTLSYVLRHLGFVAHMAGRLEEARERLERSTSIREELGFRAGVAANMVGLAYVAKAEGRDDDARAILAEAAEIAEASQAYGILRSINEARA
jgi:tetratricopeptide (TPR) repeat protein